MKPDQIAKFLQGLGIDNAQKHKRSGWVISSCPLGPWRHEVGKSSAEVFGVRAESGDPHANCFACGFHGTLGTLLVEMKHLNKAQPRIEAKWGQLFEMVDQAVIDGDLDLDAPDIEEVMSRRGSELHEFPQWWLDSFPPVGEIAWARNYLAERQVSPAMALQLDLRADTEQRRICFPVRDFKHRLVGLDGRAVNPETNPRYRMYLQAGKNNPIVWLGEDWVDLNRPIVVVEGPFDLTSVTRVYDNVVSPLFVNPSVEKLKRMADALEWITLYDRGAGGDTGREKVSKLLDADHVVHHLHPPKGRKDPGEMTFTSRFGDEVKLYSVSKEGKLIYLPRALCPVGKVDERLKGDPVEFPKAPQPRPHQVQLYDETAAFLKQGLSGVVVAYTGWGKTTFGYHAAATIKRKTLVVTTKDDIYKQWLDGAAKFLGLQPHQIGEIRGEMCEVVGTKFCVAMIHSLSKDGKYPDRITKGFGLVIFDECHRVPAEQFSEVVDMFPAKLRLALSATPDRADGKELLVYAHVGPIRAKTEAQLMVPKVLRFQSAWECPRVLRSDPETGEKRVVRLPHEPGKTTHLEKMIAADSVRNHLIGELIESAFKKGRKTVVFSTLHEHLKSLYRVCRESFSISGRDMGYYIGASTKAERDAREREKVKPILFTTFAMMSEGTSLDWLDTCILAMPRSSVTQPVGRIRREYPDKGSPVVMDIVDNDSPVFSGNANQRLRWYQSIGADVRDM